MAIQLDQQNNPMIQARSESLYKQSSEKVRQTTNLMFRNVLLMELLVFIPCSFLLTSSMQEALIVNAMGVLLTLGNLYLIRFQNGQLRTMYLTSVTQIIFAVTYVHLADARTSSLFLFFVSLVLIGNYRNWRVLLFMTILAVILTGLLFTTSHYMSAISDYSLKQSDIILLPEFILSILIVSGLLIRKCNQVHDEMREIALKRAQIERANAVIEGENLLRLAELEATTRDFENVLKERKRLEAELLHSQKMESVGQLAAGIAHEINTPTQYVGDNIRFINENLENLFKMIDAYEDLMSVQGPSGWETRKNKIEAARQTLDISFLKDEMPLAASQSLEGCIRVSEIVSAMKEFSHPGVEEKVMTNLNDAVKSTITVCRNRWKYTAEMDIQLSEDIPLIPCHVSEFNQVVLNLIVNAADAISENHAEGDMGLIKIESTFNKAANQFMLRISDNGAGISTEIQSKIFDPFFTTKDVGKGTGQGLSICHDVIVKKHGGKINFKSVPGEGTTFEIRLPQQSSQIEVKKYLEDTQYSHEKEDKTEGTENSTVFNVKSSPPEAPQAHQCQDMIQSLIQSQIKPVISQS